MFLFSKFGWDVKAFLFDKMSVCIFILKHTSSPAAEAVFRESYACARANYPDSEIIIIDDNSPIKVDLTYDDRTHIIQSEFPQRGEQLPYYYFHKLHPSDKAIIIHDSVFLKKPIDTSDIDTYRFLWDFGHDWDRDDMSLPIIEKIGNDSFTAFYKQKKEWRGCFGAMSVISWEFLNRLEEKYHMFKPLLENIKTQPNRTLLERIFACMFVLEDGVRPPLFGSIHDWAKSVTNGQKAFYIRFPEYQVIQRHMDLKIFKVWLGR